MSKFVPLWDSGLIFDIDGTLIAEGKRINKVILRPGAIEFLAWCKNRGHAIALWTAAHSSWANHVAYVICPRVCEARNDYGHNCSGGCRETFDFVWAGDKMRRRKEVPFTFDGQGCAWCQQYSFSCTRCLCHRYTFACPCRFTKDLSRVWANGDFETSRFVRDRTLIVENTPQQCINNYGNAIYVPTYQGPARHPSDENMFRKLKKFIEELEMANDVRFIQKCNHGNFRHACFEQNWMTEEIS